MATISKMWGRINKIILFGKCYAFLVLYKSHSKHSKGNFLSMNVMKINVHFIFNYISLHWDCAGSSAVSVIAWACTNLQLLMFCCCEELITNVVV